MRTLSDLQGILEQVQALPRDLVKVYVIGKTGAGKTYLIRNIMGTEQFSFPAVEKQRTTTVPTEYVLYKGAPFKATLIFKTKQEILMALDSVLREAIDVCLSNKGKNKEEILSSLQPALSETPDQTTRFKFILSPESIGEVAIRIYENFSAMDDNAEEFFALQDTFVEAEKEKIYSQIDSKVEQISGRRLGENYFYYQYDDKKSFIDYSKRMLSNLNGALVPVLSYARLEGELLSEAYLDNSFVLIDSEGVGHNLNAPPTRHFEFFEFADYIVFVEEKKDTFMVTKDYIKDVFNKGYGQRLKLVFNKLDTEEFENEKSDIKRSIRNLESGGEHAGDIQIKEQDCFFVSQSPVNKDELKRLLGSLPTAREDYYSEFRFEYNISEIVSKISQSLSEKLEGTKSITTRLDRAHWKTAYAFNLRMVNHEDQYDDFTPVYDISSSLFKQFDFDSIVKFQGQVTDKHKKQRKDEAKQHFFQHLLKYTRWLILDKQHRLWVEALQISGTGSKIRRAEAIKNIFFLAREEIKQSDFSERVKNTLDVVCAYDPRINSFRTSNGTQTRITHYKIIENAHIKLNGLTIIAGENDTGKSTISKVFFREARKNFLHRKSLAYPDNAHEPNPPVFIDTPNILDTFTFIKNTSVLLQQNKLDYDLPEHVTELVLRLSSSPSSDEPQLLFSIKNLIGGEIRYNKQDDEIIYKKESVANDIPITDTSTGIKMFGILQILIKNQTLIPGSVLILDEPEVHIHPNWQLKYAEVIVALVKQGIKVMLCSHSPYMIEALVRYSRRDTLKGLELYLTDKQNEKSTVTCVTNDIGKIFEKLSESFDVFDELEMNEIQHG
jgi:ABC-type Mn2+/Zn2+ transport system ATPase subunit